MALLDTVKPVPPKRWNGGTKANINNTSFNSMKTLHPSLRRLLAPALAGILSLAGAHAQTVTVLSSDVKLSDPGAITTDGINLYVASATTLLRLPIAGGTVTQLGTNMTPCCVLGLAVRGTNLFYIDPNGDPDATAIWRTGTNGGAPFKIYSGFAAGQPIVDGSGITTDGTALYTVDYVQGRVHTLGFDGSGISELGSRYGGFFDLEHHNAIAQSGTRLYIADDGAKAASGIPPQVVSLPKAGGAFTTLHAGAPFVSPNSIAIASNMVFVLDPGATNTIWMLPLAGGYPIKLVGGAPFTNVHSMVAHGNALYVTDTGNAAGGRIYKVTIPPVTLASSGAQMTDPGAITGVGGNLLVGNTADIVLAPAAGGTATTYVSNVTPSQIDGLAATATDLFWIDPNGDPDATAIFRAPLAGGSITKIYSGFAAGQPIIDGSDIATDGVKLYTVDYYEGRVHSMNLDGSGITPLAVRYGGGFPMEHRNAIAQGGTNLFIADDGSKAASGIPPQILRLPKAGGAFTTLRSGSPLVSPVSLTVAGTNLYIADAGGTNNVWRLPVAGGTPVKIAGGAPFVNIRGITYANGALYVTDTGNRGTTNGPGAIYRIDVPTFIEAAPINTTVGLGQPATLSVTAGGSGPFTYQWQLNGTNLAGATGSTLTFSNVSLANAGSYTVTITGPGGTVTATASLAVLDLRMYAGLTLGGAVGSQYRIEFLENLNATNWTSLTNLTLVTSPAFYVDVESPQHPTRFYRAVPLP